MQPKIIFGFDMETDIGSWTPFYEGLAHGTPRLLEVLASQDVRATFLFTGDAARTQPEIVKMADSAGHEVGCHSLYHETMGDELFPIPGVKPLLPEECYRRLEIATQIVEDILGAKVTSFRAPRLWGSTAMVNALEDLHYAADLSYPMYYYRDRLAPYHPSRTDWTAEGDMRILEFPNFADMTLESQDPYGRDRDQWPLFRTEGAEALMGHIDKMLGFYERKGLPAVFCFYMHPWEFHEMPQGVIRYGEGAVVPDPFIVKNCGGVALKELDRLISLLKERGAEFSTARDLARQYQA
ncbi:MAG: polysaccharide deacetylase family protein [Armatimonadetes bacterium]|nr:polysaccharide deacetylase family protein [Armatimonadota bacterium]